MSEHVTSVESLIEMGSSMLRYQKGQGEEDDRVSEHVASVENIIKMGSSVLRYQRGGGRSNE